MQWPPLGLAELASSFFSPVEWGWRVGVGARCDLWDGAQGWLLLAEGFRQITHLHTFPFPAPKTEILLMSTSPTCSEEELGGECEGPGTVGAR